MVVIRCTQKLLRRIGKPVQSSDRPTYGPAEPKSTTRLGDWFANLVNAGNRRFVLLVSERTRLPVIVPARDLKHLSVHLAGALPAVLQALGIPNDAIHREVAAVGQCVLAPTNSRSVLGTLNEFAFMSERRLGRDPDADLTDIALWLADTPILSLDDCPGVMTKVAFADELGNALLESLSRVRIYQLKVELMGSEPPIWRRFEVPADIWLEQLHRVLQVVMGWTNSHLHAFEKDGKTYGTNLEECEIGCVNERLTRVSEVLKTVGASLDYEYDFGDGWEHRITLEAVRDDGSWTARVLEGRRACPPEDAGGIHRYGDLLAVIADPKHPDHRDLLDWFGAAFDPDKYDVADANVQLGRLRLKPRSSGLPQPGGLVH